MGILHFLWSPFGDANKDFQWDKSNPEVLAGIVAANSHLYGHYFIDDTTSRIFNLRGNYDVDPDGVVVQISSSIINGKNVGILNVTRRACINIIIADYGKLPLDYTFKRSDFLMDVVIKDGNNVEKRRLSPEPRPNNGQLNVYTAYWYPDPRTPDRINEMENPLIVNPGDKLILGTPSGALGNLEVSSYVLAGVKIND